jgi:hypothetical protein
MYSESVSHDVIDKIAELILQDPSISVREVATRLGYAEEKTVYYWLSKRGFHGIRPFKRAVLTGQYRQVMRSASDAPRRSGWLPVVSRLSPAGTPSYTGATLPVALDRGRGLYVLQYAGPADMGILAGDYLVVGPLDLESADLVLVHTEDMQLELRHLLRPEPGSAPLFFDYSRGALDSRCMARGTILQVMRVLKPAVV